MLKEMHIWLDIVPDKLLPSIRNTINQVYRDLANGEGVVHTGLTHFCSTKTITEYNYKLFIHPTEDDMFEITLGRCARTSREITAGLNLEKLLLNHEFGGYINYPNQVNAERIRGLEEAYAQLDSIANLEDNWNDNGALAFDKNHIDFVRDLLPKLSIIPEVFPTAADSIQLKWEDDKVYLEVEIYKDYYEVFYKIDEHTVEDDTKFDLKGIDDSINFIISLIFTK